MKKFTLAVLALCLLAASVFAQTNTGRLVGTISSTDGVIAGATLIVIDQTGRERTVVTSEEGTYTLPQLEAGTYTVRVTSAGFKTFTATDVKVDIGRDYTLNATLEPGDIKEEVTVVAGADVLNTTSAELSNTVSPRQVKELPLNGRNPLALVSLQPGVSTSGQGTTVVNGQRGSSTSYFRDGINVQDNFIRSGFVPDRPNVDDTGEFTVVTSNAGAELGYGGSIVLLNTPRGQSDYHGALFLYNRNSKFAANNYFNNATGVARPFLNRNQFGGSVSGPMPLPHFGEGGSTLLRDKAFFFGSYEGFRLRQSVIAQRLLLTPNARQGLLTYTPTNSTTPVTVNVLQLAGIPGVDPIISSRILANMPTAGNNAGLGDQRNTTGLNLTRTQNQDREAFTMRLDFQPNDKHSFNFVHNYRTEENQRPDIDGNLTTGGGFGVTPFGFQGTAAPTRLFILAHTWTPGASFVNDVRGAYHFSSSLFDRTNLADDYLLTLPAFVSSPEINFRQQGRKQKNFTIQDNASYIWGDHTFRFGGIMQRYQFEEFDFAGANVPTFTLSNTGTAFALGAANFGTNISAADLATANSLVSLLGGVVNQGTLTFNATSRDSGYVGGAPTQRLDLYENYGAYITDQWRLSPQFTLNAGLRYEYYTPVREENGLYIQPAVQPGQTAAQAALNQTGSFDFIGVNADGFNAFRGDKNNFGPNVNFAWSPEFKNQFLGGIMPGGGRTVIRGGVRVGFVNDEYLKSTLNTLAFGTGLSQPVTLSPSAPTRLSSGLPGNFAQPTFPTFPRSYATNNALAAFQGTVFLVDPDIEVQRTVEWNIGVQREIGWQTAFELRYVGNMSNSALRTIDYGQLDIRGNGFLSDFNRARSNLLNFGNPACTAAQATSTGCQALTVFPGIGASQLGAAIPAGGGLANANVRTLLLQNTPAALAEFYVIRGMGNSTFSPNPNTFVANVLTNGGKFRYNGLQAEVRRRFAQGLYFQANYTFQKTLGNINVEGGGAAGQNRVDPFLDNVQPELEYSRVEFDQTHAFNLNGIYELPFGRGKRWLNSGGVVDRVFGGWSVTSILSLGSGLPISIVDPRGTLNRAGRSGRQTAQSALSYDEIRGLVGIYNTPCGLFFIDPAVINIDLARCQQGVIAARNASLTPGVAAGGFSGTTGNQLTFPGQVFFNNGAGQTGNLGRYLFDGPGYLSWDASIIKNIAITENTKFQIRAEAFNVMNNPNYSFGIGTQSQSINSNTFGRITSAGGARVIQFVGRFEF